MDHSQSGYELFVIGFYAHNIVVALPLTILIIKIVVRFVTREPAKDIFRSLLVLPLDLIYVAFGLLLAGMAGRIPAFTSRYGDSRRALEAGVVLGLSLLVVACFITWIDRGVRLLWQKFFAAASLAKQLKNDGKQMQLLGQPPTVKRAGIVYLWMFTYWALMVSMMFIQFVLAVEALGVILNRIQ